MRFYLFLLIFSTSICSAQSISEQLPKRVSDYCRYLSDQNERFDKSYRYRKLRKAAREYLLEGQSVLFVSEKGGLLGLVYEADEQLMNDADGLEHWRLMDQLNVGKRNTWTRSGFVQHEGETIFFIDLKREFRNQDVTYSYYLFKKRGLLFEIIYKNPSHT